MKGKKVLIMGIANNKSIAFGVAKQLVENGAEIILTYQNEKLKSRAESVAKDLNASAIVECDVSSSESIDAAFQEIGQITNNSLDGLIHSIAFANRANLTGDFHDLSVEDFNLAMNVSCYSLLAVVQRAKKIMNEGGSIATMTYYGAEKVIPNYNIMGVAKAALEASVKYLSVDLGKLGIRVNSISPGPIKTLAAQGIGDFSKVLGFGEKNSPLGRNVTTEEVGGTAVYLMSNLSSGVTGENIYVDAGYNKIGMPKELIEK